MKKIHIFYLAICLIGFASCSKNYLEQNPLDSYSDESVYGDLKLSSLYLNNEYRNTLEKFPWMFGFSAGCDELYSNWNWFGESNIATAAVTPDLTYMDNWSDKYIYIRDLNTFISKIEKVPGDSGLRNRLECEAKFLRAYNYFDLIRRYGGVPLITTVLDPYTSNSLSRNTYDECVTYVVNQCDSAAMHLPLTYSSDSVGRITRGAALALKSRMLLYWASPHNNTSNDMTRWQKAADAAKAVIDLSNGGSNVYSLYDPTNYASIFTTSYNSEIILCRTQSADYDEDNNVDLINSPCSYDGWSTYEPTQDIVDEFEMTNGKMISETGSGYDATQPYIGRENRFYANIVYNGCTYRNVAVENWVTLDASGAISTGGKDSQKSSGSYWNYSKTGYNMRKYMQESRTITLPSAVKPPLFRLSEIYLNYAEAENMLGNDNIAREYLNKIRTRTCVGLPALGSNITGTALRDKIRHERKIELMWENHRYFDVRRWGILLETASVNAHGIQAIKNSDNSITYSITTVQERKTDVKYYLLPIPKTELLKVSLTQNPGY